MVVVSSVTGSAREVDLERAVGRALLEMLESGGTGSPEPADVIRRLLEGSARAVSADRASLLRLDGDRLVVEGLHDATDGTLMEGLRVPLADHPDVIEAVESRAAVVAGPPNLTDLPEALRRALEGIVHRAVVPLVVAGDVVGLLTVSRRRDLPFSVEDLRTLKLISNIAALALRNATLFAAAQAAADRMSSFVDLVVHELRSPLTVIAGYIDMLQHGDLEEDPGSRERSLATVASKIAEMQSLIGELVLSARLESGAMPAPTVEVDLCDAVRRAVSRAGPRGQMVEARLETEVPPYPVTVVCDPVNIDHILDNLLNNALSYGGVRPDVCISVEPDMPVVSVTDHGPGISPEFHERVFERFFRVNPLRSQGGSGLGLHISRQLAAQCGGTLDVAFSDPLRGTRFVLRFPRESSRPGSVDRA